MTFRLPQLTHDDDTEGIRRLRREANRSPVHSVEESNTRRRTFTLHTPSLQVFN
jgi:hypothetical protein